MPQLLCYTRKVKLMIWTVPNALITLLPVLYKLFTRVIGAKMTEILDNALP